MQWTKNKEVFGLFIAGVLLILVGFILGKSSVQKVQNNNQNNQAYPTSLTPFITQSTPKPQSNKLYRVVKVIDGDTIQVEISGKIETLRLIGIDTPELVDPRKPVQCFAKEAFDKAKETLNGKSVQLEADLTQGERDKYQRLLRYVFLENGINFNQFMIVQGFAHEYTYRVPYKYQLEFKQAERQAREKKLGLWADDACLVAGTYTCDCAKLCSQIATCEEAYFQLSQCGCTKRDSDGDGIPCESLCK